MRFPPEVPFLFTAAPPRHPKPSPRAGEGRPAGGAAGNLKGQPRPWATRGGALAARAARSGGNLRVDVVSTSLFLLS